MIYAIVTQESGVNQGLVAARARLAKQGEYKQFVNNRVHKIKKEHSDVNWNHVPTQVNPADLESRGGLVSEENTLPQSQKSKLNLKQVMPVAIEHHDEINELLIKSSFMRTLRITAWISRFPHNTKVKYKQRLKGPLTAEEIESQRLFWIKRVQNQEASSDTFSDDELRLNLKPNHEGVLVCRGRIQGDYPVYLADASLYA